MEKAKLIAKLLSNGFVKATNNANIYFQKKGEFAVSFDITNPKAIVIGKYILDSKTGDYVQMEEEIVKL